MRGSEDIADDLPYLADRRCAFPVAHRKASADVDHARPHSHSGLQMRDELERLRQRSAVRRHRGALAPDVKAEAGELHTGGQHMFDEQLGIRRFGTELRRKVRLGCRISERQPDQDLDIAGHTGEFVCFTDIFDDKRPHARVIGVCDVGGLLDRIGVDAAMNRQLQPLDQVDLAACGDIEPAATDGDGGQHDRMRQRLDRVVNSEPGKRCLKLPKPACRHVRLEHEQRGSVLVRQLFPTCATLPQRVTQPRPPPWIHGHPPPRSRRAPRFSRAAR